MRGMKSGQYAVWNWIQDHPTHREKAMRIWTIFYLINLYMRSPLLLGAALFLIVGFGIPNWQGKEANEQSSVILGIVFGIIGYFFTKYLLSQMICRRLGEKLRVIVSDDESRRILNIFRLNDPDSANRIRRFLPSNNSASGNS